MQRCNRVLLAVLAGLAATACGRMPTEPPPMACHTVTTTVTLRDPKGDSVAVNQMSRLMCP